MGHIEHRSKALKRVRCAVVTISDSRSEKEDGSGKTIVSMLEEGGHEPVYLGVVKDEPKMIMERLDKALSTDGVQAVIFNGGSGINKRDTTVDTLAPRMEKILPGFGEIFRYLSFGEIGSAAMMSRAVAGLIKDRPIFCLPGSVNACRLALKELIIPELGHLVWEVSRSITTR